MSSLFPGLDSLVGLARHGVDVKPTLLRVLTDLYVQKPTHSPDEERQYVELSLRLIDAVDAATRDIVARTLAAYPGAPEQVLARLDGRPAREAAPPPPPETRGQSEARSLVRDFFNADTDGRRGLLDALDRAGPLAAGAWPTPGEEVARRLETSVLGGRPGDFVRELERALGVSRTLAERIVNDLGGEPLVVAARALAVPAPVLQRILLFVNPAIGHSVRRVYALSALYQEVSLAAALRLVAAWREAEPAATTAAPTRPGPTTAARGGTVRGRLGMALPSMTAPERMPTERLVGPPRKAGGGS
ncbi:DUF2336 domain-containing protein [Rhodoplanes sp. SY1]|uniref:DUF2336 domain-containing protein n=1 Tax=Rhodoplanes sp. SY1 TaxID=3166646 RepID=UPI0038B61191